MKKLLLLVLMCLVGCNDQMPEGSKCIDNYVYYQASKDVWLVYNNFGGSVWCASTAAAASAASK